MSDDGQAAAQQGEQLLPILPRLYERDIDVLLQEELIFNGAVRLLFSQALGLGEIALHSCQLSVVDATGETDILAKFTADGKSGMLLIENKIDAAFQPRQPERYRQRAMSLATTTDRVYCLLVAPQRYRDSATDAISHFDAVVTYEAIAAAMEQQPDARSSYRADMLRRAVEQVQSAYVLAPVEEVTLLWRRIYDIARTDFPELRMQAPSDKGGRSSWVIFKGNLPAKTTIDWKIPKGIVDLSFWPSALKKPKADIDIEELGGASFVRLGATTAIRLPLSNTPANWLTITDEEIRTGLTAARAMLKFFAAHPDWFVTG